MGAQHAVGIMRRDGIGMRLPSFHTTLYENACASSGDWPACLNLPAHTCLRMTFKAPWPTFIFSRPLMKSLLNTIIDELKLLYHESLHNVHGAAHKRVPPPPPLMVLPWTSKSLV